jgi:hypothetical protein
MSWRSSLRQAHHDIVPFNMLEVVLEPRGVSF